MKDRQSVRVISNKGAIVKLFQPVSSGILAALQDNELNIHQLSIRLCVPKSSIRRYLLELKAENLVSISRMEKKRGLEVKYYTTTAKYDFPHLNLIASSKTSLIGIESLFREIRYFVVGYLLGKSVSMEKINKTISGPATSKMSPADKIEYMRRKRLKDTIEGKEIEDREFAIKRLCKKYPLIWNVLEEIQRIIENEDHTLEDPTLSSEQIFLLLIHKAIKRVLARSREENSYK